MKHDSHSSPLINNIKDAAEMIENRYENKRKNNSF